MWFSKFAEESIMNVQHKAEESSPKGLRRRFAVQTLVGAVGACALTLSGCGFQLRQTASLSFKTVFLITPRQSALMTDLRRAMAANSELKVLTEANDMASAEVVLDVMSEARDRVVVGLNASGQVRELQLRLRVRFRLRTPQGKVLIPEVELQQQRDLSFLESAALAKEIEENTMYRDMQVDIVQQMMRRLAAVKTL
jgi:LPS-assembly lipoprotein